MTRRDIRQSKNPELRGSFEAMQRAGRMARRKAIETNTCLIRVENGKVVRVPPEQLRREMKDSAHS